MAIFVCNFYFKRDKCVELKKELQKVKGYVWRGFGSLIVAVLVFRYY